MKTARPTAARLIIARDTLGERGADTTTGRMVGNPDRDDSGAANGPAGVRPRRILAAGRLGRQASCRYSVLAADSESESREQRAVPEGRNTDAAMPSAPAAADAATRSRG